MRLSLTQPQKLTVICLLTIIFLLSSSVHTLKNLISQDETPTGGNTPQKCKCSLFLQLKQTSFFLSFPCCLDLRLMILFAFLQLLALSPCYLPSGARIVKRNRQHDNMDYIFEGDGAACIFRLFWLWIFTNIIVVMWKGKIISDIVVKVILVHDHSFEW